MVCGLRYIGSHIGRSERDEFFSTQHRMKVDRVDSRMVDGRWWTAWTSVGRSRREVSKWVTSTIAPGTSPVHQLQGSLEGWKPRAGSPHSRPKGWRGGAKGELSQAQCFRLSTRYPPPEDFSLPAIPFQALASSLLSRRGPNFISHLHHS